jgi:hypothetical protein
MKAWQSGRRARKPITRLLPVIVAAFTVSLAFDMASILSSNLTNKALHQVLLKGTRCGYYDLQEANNVYKKFTLMLPKQAAAVSRFLNYGQQCYKNES